MHRHLRHDRHCRFSDHEKKPAYTAVSLHHKIGVLETTMYADSVFSESGGSDQYQMQDLIPDSILTYHVRSIRSAPSASRAIPGLSSGGCWTGQYSHGNRTPRRISTGRPALRAAGRKYHCPLRWSWHNCRCHLPFGSSLRFSLLRKVRDHGAPVIACSQSKRKFLMMGIRLSKFKPFNGERYSDAIITVHK